MIQCWVTERFCSKSADIILSSLSSHLTTSQIGVAMIAARKGPIQYAILFGGDQFMLFSLFHNKDDSGAMRFGLFCSDIIETCSTDFPIIPLTIFMLLGKDGPASLVPSEIPIPPVSSGQKEKKVRKRRTMKDKISQSLQKFIPDEACSDISREFDLTCESRISSG
jgi:hypothetical protein